MIKLHGFPMSNYYNAVKMTLLEKGLEFEEVANPPSQKPEFLAISPMGKVPALETEHGYLAESQAIINYLEEIQPTPALLPADPWQRAKVRQLMHSIELYIELVARRGLMEVAFNRPVTDEVKKSVAKDMPKGVAAIQSLVKFDPWIAGSEFTAADIFGMQSFGLANRISTNLVGFDLIGSVDGAADWMARVSDRASAKRCAADQAG